MNASITPAHSRDAARTGLIAGLAAYGLWGVLPIYFKALHAIPPVDIVAHRITWSLFVVAILMLVFRAGPAVRTALADRRTMLLLVGTSLLIGVNWLLYVYAINTGHILAGSLGYYLNPLANILLGRFILHERLSRLQWLAVAIAGAGIAVLAAGALGSLWISLTLCISFSSYGLLRKIARVDALAGLAIETAILFPLAVAWLLIGHAHGRPWLGTTPGETWLLLAAGVISTTPLLLFTAAARRLRYSTLGMLQFLAPTLQFLLAVFLYGEPFTHAHAIAFGAIWSALALYVASLIATYRAEALPDRVEPA